MLCELPSSCNKHACVEILFFNRTCISFNHEQSRPKSFASYVAVIIYYFPYLVFFPLFCFHYLLLSITVTDIFHQTPYMSQDQAKLHFSVNCCPVLCMSVYFNTVCLSNTVLILLEMFLDNERS